MNSMVQIDGKEYKIAGTIGQGAAAIVYLAKDNDDKSYALKMIKNYNNPIIKQMVDAEIRIQKQFQGNKYVIQYVGFQKTSKLVYLILELGECSLRHWIETNDEIWQVELINILCDVCQGLVNIHEKKFIHRDIKPENIIKKDNLYKITDFGVSCQRQQDESITGTPLYWAPEILFEKTNKFTNKIDVWSFGVSIFEVYFKVNPFCPGKKLGYQQSIEELKRNIRQLTPNFSMKNFIEFLKKRKENQKINYIEKKLKNTDKNLVQNICLFFEPCPEKRPDMQLLLALFESLRGQIQMPQIKKTKKSRISLKWEEIPEDIRLFCKTKDLFYQISTFFKTKLYDKIIFALQLGIWYLEGANYDGINYIFLDKMNHIKSYRKPVAELQKQLKSLLSQYYFYLKCEQEVKGYQKLTEVRMHILICSVWLNIMKDDQYFCSMVQTITGLQIEYPLRMFTFLEVYSQKNICEIQQKIISRYYQ